MLVLARNANESMKYDAGIEVSVVTVNGNRVKSGIAAPQSVNIPRSELLPFTSSWSDAETPPATSKSNVDLVDSSRKHGVKVNHIELYHPKKRRKQR